MNTRYPPEVLDEYEDDGTMPANLAELGDHVVGHRIVWVGTRDKGLSISLDNGNRVTLVDTFDCCAYTELEAFFLDPSAVDHVITGVGSSDGFTVWHIYADWGDILRLMVRWDCGNPFYYGYGFSIRVVEEGLPEL